MPTNNQLPLFSSIDSKTFVQQLEAHLQNNLATIDQLLQNNSHYTWDNLIMPLDELSDGLERFWSPLSHLHAVMDAEELRICYESCLPLLSAYESAIGQNHQLYNAIHSIDKSILNKTQQKILADSLRDFELSGVALPSEEKKRFEMISTRLSELSNQFKNNVLDATQTFTIHITDEERLTGLPEHALYRAKEVATEKGLDGYLLTLEYPCFYAVMSYAEDRALREELYRAYITRASEQGPLAGQFDNTAIMNEMLALRQEKAQLLGFENYAQLSLATKMANSTDEVMAFLNDLVQRARPQARSEFRELEQFAQDSFHIAPIKAWDVSFLSEKRRQARYAISQEELRPYFPESRVMNGLFAIIEKLYGVTLKPVDNVDLWHQDAQCYAVVDAAQQTRGYVYTDLYSRSNKHSGAWMDSLQSRRICQNGEVQLPIATLTCNFAKSAANKPALLSHDEVLTLFHEMGHCLHHLLTKVDYLSGSGIHGVEWDAVELPSQFFENWCWDKEALNLLTAHIDTGASLPDVLLNKLLAAKNFQSAMAMMRQMELALFDFCIHQNYKANATFIVDQLAQIRQKTNIIPLAPYNRFQHSFSHIFAGGYAAGYYSYSWAEVLSSDAFARFEEEGIFNPQTGRDFLTCILEVGGSQPAAEAYQHFRGRKATIDALLRHHGISNKS